MVLKGREGREGNVWCEYGKKVRLMGRVAKTMIHQQKGGHEWTDHERALPAIKLDGDEYSAQRSDFHRPMAWIWDGGTPAAARDVAPPARIE